MTNLTTIVYERLMRPIYGLISDADIKAIVAFLFSAMYVVGDILGRVFAGDALLISSLIILMTIDWITGVFRAWLREEQLFSLGFRASVVKFIEYFIAIITAIVLSNMHEMLNWVQVWAAVFLAVTEAKSIWENIFIDNKINLVKAFMKKLKDQTGVELPDQDDEG